MFIGTFLDRRRVAYLSKLLTVVADGMVSMSGLMLRLKSFNNAFSGHLEYVIASSTAAFGV